MGLAKKSSRISTDYAVEQLPENFNRAPWIAVFEILSWLSLLQYFRALFQIESVLVNVIGTVNLIAFGLIGFSLSLKPQLVDSGAIFCGLFTAFLEKRVYSWSELLALGSRG